MVNFHKKAIEPFYFYTHLNLQELTGQKARNLLDLANLLKTVPGSAIFQHTHMFIQERSEIVPEYTNDFAYWVKNILGEDRLSEELASIDLMSLQSVRAIREKIIGVIEKNLFERNEGLKSAPIGKEFEFVKSHSFVMPTSYVAESLADFLKILKKVDIDSIYFHLFIARLRLEKGVNDFSNWLETSLLEPELAEKVSAIDLYTHTLEGLREKIVKVLREE